MRLLYFHGFASSPGSAKVVALRPLLAAHGIEMHVPDMNVPSFERLDFDAMVDVGRREAERVNADAIAGSSLGALIALAVASHGFDVPLALIAPALGIADTWLSRIPQGDPITVPNYAVGHDLPIHRAFFEQMATVDVDRDAPSSRVIVLMGRDDETVEFTRVEQAWSRWSAAGLPAGSRMIPIEGGDHSLVAHSELIASAIASLFDR